MTFRQRLTARALKLLHEAVLWALRRTESWTYGAAEVFLAAGEGGDMDLWRLEGRVVNVRVEGMSLRTYLTCNVVAVSPLYDRAERGGVRREPVQFHLAAADLRKGPVPGSYFADRADARILLAVPVVEDQPLTVKSG